MRFEQLKERYQETGLLPPHPVLLQKVVGELADADRTAFVLYPRPRTPMILGRNNDVALTLPDRNVSGKHAQLLPPKPGTTTWYVLDLGSTNGSYVEERPLEPHKPVSLRDMDVLRFGPASIYHFLLPASLERVLKASRTTPQTEGAPPPGPKPARRPGPGPGPRPTRRGPPPRPSRPGGPRPAPGKRAGPPRGERGPEAAPAPTDAPSEPPEVAEPVRAAEPVEAPAAQIASPAQAERYTSDRSPPPTKLPDDFVLKLLGEARTQAASDVHLTPTMPPILRVNGELVRRKGPMLSPTDTEALIWQVTDQRQRDEFFSGGDLDTCQQIGKNRYRLNLAQSRMGTSLSFRVISETVPTLEELGIPPAAAELTKYAQGMVLITGPLGAGKTTTMFSLVDLVNRTRPEHIITIEDPVEFLLPPQMCQVAQRERGRHTASFGAALRGALREDPDIIVIGDLRDYETASLAISAAETGHLVFASMATMNAMKSIDKLIDLFPAGEQATTRTMFSESLRGILCQRLLPGVDGKRVPAVELVFNSIAVANIIRDGNTAALLNAMQTGKSQGMRSFENSLKELLDRKAITRETADQARAE